MRGIVAVMLLLAAAVSTARAADTCELPDGAVTKAGGYEPAVAAVVKAAKGCDRAYKKLTACQLSTSGDNALANIVRSKCEPAFLPKAGAAIKAAYKTGKARCDTIAEKNEGSMYQSFAAVCQAKLARDFACKYRR